MTTTITKRYHSQTGELLENVFSISGEEQPYDEWDRLRRELLGDDLDDARFSYEIRHDEHETLIIDYSLCKSRHSEPCIETAAQYYPDDASSYIEPPHGYSRRAIIERLKLKDWLKDLRY